MTAADEARDEMVEEVASPVGGGAGLVDAGSRARFGGPSPANRPRDPAAGSPGRAQRVRPVRTMTFS